MSNVPTFFSIRTMFFLLFNIVIVQVSLGQDLLIKTSGDTLHIKITKVGSENISYKYPGEDMIYELPKHDFAKAIYKSGREDVFNKKALLKLTKSSMSYTDSLFLTIGFSYIGSVKEINLDGVVFIKKGSQKVLQVPYSNISRVWYKKKYYNYSQIQTLANSSHFVKEVNMELEDINSYKVYIGNHILDGLEIKQIRFDENSTFIYFSYTNMTLKKKRICVNEELVIQGEYGRTYKLLSSINMPFCNKKAILQSNEELRFILEFEKIPMSIGKFDLIDKSINNYNIKGIKILYDKKINLDMADFVNETPVMEFGSFFKDGNPIQYYKKDGLYISIMTNLKISYGKYYCVYILIDNFSGEEVLFNPDKIDVKILDYRSEIINGNMLSYETYMKTVKHQQAANNFLSGFFEIATAIDAGYSSSKTVTSTSSYGGVSARSSSYARGVYKTSSGSAVGFKNSISVSHTKSYDGSAAYFARQQAISNIKQNKAENEEVLKTIEEGYLKKTTIFNGERYYGYVNIKYVEGENMKLDMTIKGDTFIFNLRIY